MQNGNRGGHRSRTTAVAAAAGIDPVAVPRLVGFGMLGVGETAGHALMKAGLLRYFKIGRATNITTESIRSEVARRLAEEEARRASKAA